ncbi:hypothetical protein EZI54_07245 [Marinobacter halodurans]|uniref:Uncharacterized protein n=1 Tax=Marinobacter halodurans TaxID=2528979 RepID=A0ABY1ZPY6_9GAMM|nr:hypothetical protein [Marinobacter halodurans]TBW57447.1 hypothetical protein EZI54_07245 [Marinobacter halodurans]
MSIRKPLSQFVFSASLALPIAMAPTAANACACLSLIPQATSMAGLVMAGTEQVSMAMYNGFNDTAGATADSTAKQTKSLVDGLEAMTTTLVNEIRQVPVTEEEIERRKALADPAEQATAPCRYSDRSADLGGTEKLAAAQLASLDKASADYNELPSVNNDPAVQSSSSRFYARAAKALKEREGIDTVGAKLLSDQNGLGSFSQKDIENASLFTNMTINPDPPARIAEPKTISDINSNVDADLYNLRMSLPQAVMNQLYSYKAPALEVADDSWVARQLKMAGISPNANENPLSYDDLLKVMATHRVNSIEWITNLSAKSKSGALKDMAMVQADSAFMDYELWKQEKSTAMLMSQLLASKLRKEKEE